MKKIIFLGLVISFVSLGLHKESLAAPPPSWTLELSGSLFYPEDDNWSTYYGNDEMLEVNASFARRLFWVFDIGAAVGYSMDRGSAFLPSSGNKEGSATFEKMPVDIFLLFRARFAEGQWLVPYIGGGFTRFYYRQKVEDQSTIQGAINGEHVRAGLQILLDPLERDSAMAMYENYGVINSYLFLEAKQTTVETDGSSVKLGGINYNVGFMLEY